MDDFVRVGGLAAVSAALPRALRRWSDVRIMLPGYRDIVEQFTHIEIVGECPSLAEMPACSLGRAATKDGLPVYVLLCPQLYDRPGNPYGDESGRDWPDNDIRFGRFASAAAELAAGTLDKNWAADLVHANDWQAALAPAYLAWRGSKVPSILTIHNLAYQGLFPQDSLRRIGAPESSFHIDGLEFYDHVSFLKGGLVYASHLTTVSATYAKEITTRELGCGLEGLLQRRSDAAQARRIFAGSDFTLMPSRFEPCGLSQMYAQRFGSLPIGHQTGGLAETIKDGETGFLFPQPSAESFLGGVRRAFDTFRAKDRLDSMRRSAMARSFSWDLSAALYSALYRKTIAPSIIA